MIRIRPAAETSRAKRYRTRLQRHQTVARVGHQIRQSGHRIPRRPRPRSRAALAYRLRRRSLAGATRLERAACRTSPRELLFTLQKSATKSRTTRSAAPHLHHDRPCLGDSTPTRRSRSDRPPVGTDNSRNSHQGSHRLSCVLAAPASGLVPTVGLEPTMPKGPGILSPVRMPIPPRRRSRLNPAILSRSTFKNLSQGANLVCSRQGRGAMIAMGMCWNW